MRYANLTLIAILSLLTSCANQPGKGIAPIVVKMPAPPWYMGACKGAPVKAGDAPNVAFDSEHQAFKECSRQGVMSRHWYLRLRSYYASPK